MVDKDWEEAWERNEIGFHQSRGNGDLVEYGERVWGPTPGRVLVPLCGKSHDMTHIASTATHVVGVEFVEKAVQDFFAELDLSPTVSIEPVPRYDAGPYSLFAADFFAITRELTGPIDAVFDRAALVALDADTRVRYAEHLTSLLDPGAAMLLVAFDYDQTEMAGPPFAVSDDEVHRLYGDAFDIEVLNKVDALNEMMKSRGATAFTSTAFSLFKRD